MNRKHLYQYKKDSSPTEDYRWGINSFGYITAYYPTGFYETLEEDLEPVCPATVNGITVIGIAIQGLYNSPITSIDFSEISGEFRFLESALDNCTNLEHLTFAQGTILIDNTALANCPNLALEYPITFPDSISTFGSHSFANDELLGDTTMPASLSNVPDNCFANCTNMGKTNLQNVANVEYHGFFHCPLTEITIGMNVVLDSDTGTMGTNGDFSKDYDGTEGTWTYDSGGGKWSLAK